MNDNRNIKQSNIFERNSSPTQKKIKNKSMSPFSDLPGMSLKGSIMPLGNFGEIKEENEEYNSINDNKEKEDDKEDEKEKKNNNNQEIQFGGEYIGDDYEDEEEQKREEEIKKEKKKKIKQSRLKMSLNNNIFNFTNKNDENYADDLKNEINDLYKKRDKMEDQIIEQQDKINEQSLKIKQSVIENNELKRIIEEKNKEIEKLKKK